jgi:7-cyano-7-deazaguanine synthase
MNNSKIHLPSRRRVLLLYSGGFDSSVLLRALLDKNNTVECLLVDYGQRHKLELSYARRFAALHDVAVHERTIAMPQNNALTNIDEPLNGKEEEYDFIVPYRNMILLSHGCSIAKQEGLDVVAFGANWDDSKIFGDCRPEFIQAMSKAASMCHGVTIVAPFVEISKREIVTRVANLMTPRFNAADTYSCYGGEKPCGWCGACKKRDEALTQLV